MKLGDYFFANKRNLPYRIPTNINPNWLSELLILLKSTVSLQDINKHIADTYAQKTQLIEALQYLYCAVKSKALTDDMVYAIGLKLEEGVKKCTPGFHIRVIACLNICYVARTLQELLTLIREDYVTRIASQEIEKKGKDPALEIHTEARFFTLGSPLFGVSPKNAEDPHDSDIPDDEIKKALEQYFDIHYQLFPILLAVQSRLLTILREKYMYLGPLASGYEEDYPKWVEFLSGMLEIPDHASLTKSLLIRNEANKIIDLNWRYILKRVLQIFINHGAIPNLTSIEEKNIQTIVFFDDAALPIGKKRMKIFCTKIVDANPLHLSEFVSYAISIFNEADFETFYSMITTHYAHDFDKCCLLAGTVLLHHKKTLSSIIKNLELTDKHYNRILAFLIQHQSSAVKEVFDFITDPLMQASLLCNYFEIFFGEFNIFKSTIQYHFEPVSLIFDVISKLEITAFKKIIVSRLFMDLNTVLYACKNHPEALKCLLKTLETSEIRPSAIATLFATQGELLLNHIICYCPSYFDFLLQTLETIQTKNPHVDILLPILKSMLPLHDKKMQKANALIYTSNNNFAGFSCITKILEKLKDKGFDITILLSSLFAGTTEGGFNALMNAAYYGSHLLEPLMVLLLNLENMENFDTLLHDMLLQTDEHNQNAFHFASNNSLSIKILLTLVDRIKDVNLKYDVLDKILSCKSLFKKLIFNAPDCILLILERLKPFDKHDFDIVCLEIINIPNNNGDTGLHHAVKHCPENIYVFFHLLSYISNPEEQKKQIKNQFFCRQGSLLTMALYYKQIESIKILFYEMDNALSPEESDELLMILLSLTDKYGNNAFILAAHHTSAILALLFRRIDKMSNFTTQEKSFRNLLLAHNSNHENAIMIAARYNPENILEFLYFFVQIIKNNQDAFLRDLLFQQDNQGINALMLMVEHHPDKIYFLKGLLFLLPDTIKADAIFRSCYAQMEYQSKKTVLELAALKYQNAIPLLLEVCPETYRKKIIEKLLETLLTQDKDGRNVFMQMLKNGFKSFKDIFDCFVKYKKDNLLNLRKFLSDLCQQEDNNKWNTLMYFVQYYPEGINDFVQFHDAFFTSLEKNPLMLCYVLHENADCKMNALMIAFCHHVTAAQTVLNIIGGIERPIARPFILYKQLVHEDKDGKNLLYYAFIQGRPLLNLLNEAIQFIKNPLYHSDILTSLFKEETIKKLIPILFEEPNHFEKILYLLKMIKKIPDRKYRSPLLARILQATNKDNQTIFMMAALKKAKQLSYLYHLATGLSHKREMTLSRMLFHVDNQGNNLLMLLTIFYPMGIPKLLNIVEKISPCIEIKRDNLRTIFCQMDPEGNQAFMLAARYNDFSILHCLDALSQLSSACLHQMLSVCNKDGWNALLYLARLYPEFLDEIEILIARENEPSLQDKIRTHLLSVDVFYTIYHFHPYFLPDFLKMVNHIQDPRTRQFVVLDLFKGLFEKTTGLSTIIVQHQLEQKTELIKCIFNSGNKKFIVTFLDDLDDALNTGPREQAISRKINLLIKILPYTFDFFQGDIEKYIYFLVDFIFDSTDIPFISLALKEILCSVTQAPPHCYFQQCVEKRCKKLLKVEFAVFCHQSLYFGKNALRGFFDDCLKEQFISRDFYEKYILPTLAKITPILNYASRYAFLPPPRNTTNHFHTPPRQSVDTLSPSASDLPPRLPSAPR